MIDNAYSHITHVGTGPRLGTTLIIIYTVLYRNANGFIMTLAFPNFVETSWHRMKTK